MKGLLRWAITLSFFIFGTTAGAATIYVNSTGAPPLSDPTAAIYTTIQDGINGADPGDTVQVAEGTYEENIILKGGIRLYGFKATIDGGRKGSVVTAIDVKSRTIIAGFTIQNGYSKHGGGFYLKNSAMTIRSCIIKSNESEDAGGGIHSVESNPSVTHCLIENNKCGNQSGGGGMFNGPGTSPVIDNCTFSSNEARGYDGTSQSYRYGNGGGLYNALNSSPTITDCDFISNFAGRGGALYNYQAEPNLLNCLFEENLARWDAGAVMNSDASDSVFTNCIFWKNQGMNGGGVYNQLNAEIMLQSCTFVGNRCLFSSTSEGGAVFTEKGANALIINSIVWENMAPQISGLSQYDVAFSDIQGGSYDWIGNIDKDPEFVDPDNGDFRLRSTSPCIDSGFTYPLYLSDKDFDNDPRVVDGDSDGSEKVDMGAYEYDPLGFAPIIKDFQLSLN